MDIAAVKLVQITIFVFSSRRAVQDLARRRCTVDDPPQCALEERVPIQAPPPPHQSPPVREPACTSRLGRGPWIMEPHERAERALKAQRGLLMNESALSGRLWKVRALCPPPCGPAPIAPSLARCSTTQPSPAVNCVLRSGRDAPVSPHHAEGKPIPSELRREEAQLRHDIELEDDNTAVCSRRVAHYAATV